MKLLALFALLIGSVAALKVGNLPDLSDLTVDIFFSNKTFAPLSFTIYRYESSQQEQDRWLAAVKNMPQGDFALVVFTGRNAEGTVIYGGTTVTNSSAYGASTVQVYSIDSAFDNGMNIPYLMGDLIVSNLLIPKTLYQFDLTQIVVNPHDLYCRLVQTGDAVFLSNFTLANAFSWLVDMGHTRDISCNYDFLPFIFTGRTSSCKKFNTTQVGDLPCAVNIYTKDAHTVSLVYSNLDATLDPTFEFLITSTYQYFLDFSGITYYLFNDIVVDTTSVHFKDSINVYSPNIEDTTISPSIITPQSLAAFNQSIMPILLNATSVFPIIPSIYGLFNPASVQVWHFGVATGPSFCHSGIFNYTTISSSTGSAYFFLNTSLVAHYFATHQDPLSSIDCIFSVQFTSQGYYSALGNAIQTTVQTINLHLEIPYNTTGLPSGIVAYQTYPSDGGLLTCTAPFLIGGYVMFEGGENGVLTVANSCIQPNYDIRNNTANLDNGWTPDEVVLPFCYPAPNTCVSDWGCDLPFISVTCDECLGPIDYELQGPCFDNTNACTPNFGILFSISNFTSLDIDLLQRVYGSGNFKMHFHVSAIFPGRVVTKDFTFVSSTDIINFLSEEQGGCRRRSVDAQPAKRDYAFVDVLDTLILNMIMINGSFYLGFNETEIDALEAAGNNPTLIADIIAANFPGGNVTVIGLLVEEAVPTMTAQECSVLNNITSLCCPTYHGLELISNLSTPSDAWQIWGIIAIPLSVVSLLAVIGGFWNYYRNYGNYSRL
jgi:hypothetical protein